MIGGKELAMMKNTAYLINTARGPVVDEAALYEALKNGIIAGAGLDVFHQEPVNMDNPLLTLDNVVVAPHMGSASVETRTEMSVMNAKDILAVLAGQAPINLVNPEVKKVRPL
jgi:glyoxylate reductase